MATEAKLVIIAEGEEAFAFLQDVEAVLQGMREGWNDNNSQAVVSLTSRLQNGI